jgi:hypothetical protein
MNDSESKEINLNTKYASIKIKELGEEKYALWIMQI